MKLELPMQTAIGNSTTFKVWEILTACRDGNLEKVKQLVAEEPGLIYAQYNYTPPIHFAVREGHLKLVEYLLGQGALDPTYITYPFKDSLLTVAQDRDYFEVAQFLQQYLSDPSLCKFKGDNGAIDYQRTEIEQQFENAVDKNDVSKAEEILKYHPALVHNETFFWGEGILMMPAKDGDQKMVELLMRYGAKVPALSKWGRFYYFKHYSMAVYLMENGMNANHMTWHHVTLLHDMAHEGDIQKAALLLRYGAELNVIEEEYQSTPLALAVKWGNTQMVDFLLQQGADPNKSGALWSTPLAWARKKGHVDIEDILLRAGAR